MKLIKARLRGLEPSTASQWFDLDPRLNLFTFSEPIHGTNFLRILQTLNPPYEPEVMAPFAHFPTIEEKNGYSRRVTPAKRTIALGVFEAPPTLVGELSQVSDLLYEVDRVEVGRRLDYSRWINFVELASSTRWSEISQNVESLIDSAAKLSPGSEKTLAQLTAGLQPTDRIVDGLAGTLLQRMDKLPQQVRENLNNLMDTVQTGVRRAEYFKAAREIVYYRIPLLVVIGCPGSPGETEHPGLAFDSTSCDNLLKLIEKHIDKTRQREADGKDLFLKRLEKQLEAVQPPDMKLSLEGTATGKILLKNRGQLCTGTGDPQSLLQQLQAKTCLAIAISREIYKTEPILMFDQPETGLPKAFHDRLTSFIISVSKFCQCFSTSNLFEIYENGFPGRKYSLDELGMVV